MVWYNAHLLSSIDVEYMRHMYLWRTEFVRNSGLVMKPVRCEAVGKKIREPQCNSYHSDSLEVMTATMSGLFSGSISWP